MHLAVTGLLDALPDIVISGINDGANMGDDTIYSGTVAAATEGFLLGIPSVAISLVAEGGGHFEAAARVACELVERFRSRPLMQPVLLNVNVPDVAYEALRGTVVTRLGKRHKAEPVVKSTTPRGEVVYWVGAAGPAADGSAPSARPTLPDRVAFPPPAQAGSPGSVREDFATPVRANPPGNIAEGSAPPNIKLIPLCKRTPRKSVVGTRNGGP